MITEKFKILIIPFLLGLITYAIGAWFSGLNGFVIWISSVLVFCITAHIAFKHAEYILTFFYDEEQKLFGSKKAVCTSATTLAQAPAVPAPTVVSAPVQPASTTPSQN